MDEPIAEDQHPVCESSGFEVMGDHDDRAPVPGRFTKQSEHISAGCGIKRTRRLVGQHDVGAHREHAGDRDSLLLPSRELTRSMPAAIPETDVDERPINISALDASAGETCGKRDVLPRG